MSLFSNVLNNGIGAVLITIIIGVGLACIFRSSCKNGVCITHLAPPSLDGKEFKWKNNCYKYTRENTKCPKDDSLIISK